MRGGEKEAAYNNIVESISGAEAWHHRHGAASSAWQREMSSIENSEKHSGESKISAASIKQQQHQQHLGIGVAMAWRCAAWQQLSIKHRHGARGVSHRGGGINLEAKAKQASGGGGVMAASGMA